MSIPGLVVRLSAQTIGSDTIRLRVSVAYYDRPSSAKSARIARCVACEAARDSRAGKPPVQLRAKPEVKHDLSYGGQTDNAASRRGGDIGSSVIRLPVAIAIALAIAAMGRC
jgi:hypothetical protein